MNILITGGSASGKSTYAEALALRLPAPRFLIDTARPDPMDAARPRWRAHMRAAGFTLLTRDTDMGGLCLPARGTAIVDCLCHLTANEMFDARGLCGEPFSAVAGGIRALGARCGDLIVVTNEVGCGAGPYSAETRRYIEALGRVNMALAADFDNVYALVCGIPLVRKGRLL